MQYSNLQFFRQTRVEFEKEHLSHSIELEDIDTLPEQGFSTEKVLKEAKKYIGLGHSDWKTGSESGTVYNGRCVLFRLYDKCYYNEAHLLIFLYFIIHCLRKRYSY